NLRAIIDTHPENCCRRAMPQSNPVCYLLSVPDNGQIFSEVAVKNCRLRWKHGRQSVMCSLADRRVHGHWTRRGMCPGVACVTADHRVESVKHRDVCDRHCTAGTAGSELLSENAILSRRDRRV